MLRFLADTFLKPVLSRYLRRERRWRYRGFDLRILPGVFHPAFFFSSKYLFSFVQALPLRGKACLEIGCGSGLISLLMARQGGLVTAIDLSSEAVRNTRINFERHASMLTPGYHILRSNLFEALPSGTFDLVVINPPYFFKEARNEQEYAWNCGAGGEYFQSLFSGLSEVLARKGKVYMVLAENCDLPRISGLAEQQGWHLVERDRRRIWWELNFIFEIERLSSSNLINFN